MNFKKQISISPIISRSDSGNELYNIELISKQLDENASSINDISYYFDFQLLPQGSYYVTFSYLGKFQKIRQNNNAVNRIEKVFQRPYIFCDLGQCNSYMPDSSLYFSNSTTKLLGFLFLREEFLESNPSASDFNFFNSCTNNNVPIYLENRPNQTEIRVQIQGYDWFLNEFSPLSISGVSFYNANNNRFPKDYSLTLHFELINKK